jgi:DNA-binding response OmpR family regulator
VARVLVVEDDPAIQHAYVFVLQKAGFTVDVAGDGSEAIRQVENLPDVVLLDMLMPGFSGLDFLREGKIKERFPKMKVIALTNIDSGKVRSEAMELGADKYLIKVTLNPGDIVNLVHECIGDSAVEQAG